MSIASLWQPTHKVCIDCRRRLPLRDFYPDATARDGRQGRCIPCKKRRNHAEYQRRKARARPAPSARLMVHRPAAPALPPVTDLNPSSRVATIHRLLTHSTRLPPEQTRVIAEQIAHTLERAQPHAADPGLGAAVARLGSYGQTAGIDLSTLGTVLDSVMRELSRAERVAFGRAQAPACTEQGRRVTASPASRGARQSAALTATGRRGSNDAPSVPMGVWALLGLAGAGALVAGLALGWGRGETRRRATWGDDEWDEDEPEGETAAASVLLRLASTDDEDEPDAAFRTPHSAFDAVPDPGSVPSPLRVCRTCGGTFITTDGRIRYCSPDCREEGRWLGPRFRG